MRLDDVLTASLDSSPREAGTLHTAQWVQIADLLAHRGAMLEPATLGRALRFLATTREQVPHRVRRDCARSLAGNIRFAPLIALFAHDREDIAFEVLDRAMLDADGWRAVIPSLSTAAMERVRRRRDLPSGIAIECAPHPRPQVMRPAIGQEVARRPAPRADETTTAAQPAETPTIGQDIGGLVRRIEAFRDGREARRGGVRSGTGGFAFETGAEGLVRWVDGAPRGPLIGLSIAAPARPGLPGTDAAAAGAFRHRGEIRNARISLPDITLFEGEWRFSAMPVFERSGGRFMGYRGWVRRAMTAEDARATRRATQTGAGALDDSLRQLIHELRTPLNAMGGFAQMIEGEVLGPASDYYRGLASEIARDSLRSLDAIERIDSSLDHRRTEHQPA